MRFNSKCKCHAILYEAGIVFKTDYHSETPIWHTAYDCLLHQEIIYRILTHVLPADNPQQSETCSHMGVNANLNSRVDYIGGTIQEKESDAGYHALFEVTDLTCICNIN
jgi:hypothetical protein